MKRVSFIPSLLTVANFSCGFIALVLCLQSVRLHERFLALADTDAQARAGEFFFYACGVIFVAMIFDMLDGRVARMTGSVSKFGGELDSLADDCTFGVAPAAIVTTLWVQCQPAGKSWYGLVMFCGIIYAACTILRLARYNVESGSADKNYFKGLPSPAAAGAVVSAVFFCIDEDQPLMPLWRCLAGYVGSPDFRPEVIQAYGLGLYMLVIGVLMVGRIRFVHVANRYLGGRRPLWMFVAFLFLLLLLFSAPEKTLFVAFNGYVLVSLVGHAWQMTRRKPATAPASGVVAAAPAESAPPEPASPEPELPEPAPEETPPE